MKRKFEKYLVGLSGGAFIGAVLPLILKGPFIFKLLIVAIVCFLWGLSVPQIYSWFEDR